MSFNGSGTFLVNTSGQPVVSATTISSSVFNALTADLATGLSTAICKDGQSVTTARISFIFGINSSLTTDTTSGGSGSIFTAGGLGVTKAIFAGSSIIYLGGTTASEVSLRRSGAILLSKLADNSAFCEHQAAVFSCNSSILHLGDQSSSAVSLRQSGAQLRVRLGDDSDWANVNAKDVLAIGGHLYISGATSSTVMLKNSTTTLQVRRGDDGADGGLICGDLTTTGTVNIGGGASGTFVTSVTVTNGIVTGGT